MVGVYLADWNDSRLSHVNPRDTWDKGTGRIYRLRTKQMPTVTPFDLSTYTNSELVALLSSPNKWFRQQALRIFGDRKDGSAVPLLQDLFQNGNEQEALEALWAIHLSGAFHDDLAMAGINHHDPYVRLWAVRLIGDDHQASALVANQLTNLAMKEAHLEVLGQLASTAKRLAPTQALPIIEALMKNENNKGDWDNQLLLWWALESIAESARDNIIERFQQTDLWTYDLVKNFMLHRLIQRYAIAGGHTNFMSIVQLIRLAPSEAHQNIIFNGLQEGLSGRNIGELPQELVSALQHYQAKYGDGPLAIALQQNDPATVEQALAMIANANSDKRIQQSYIKIFGEIDQPQVVPVLLNILPDPQFSDGIKIACLKTLKHYPQDEIGKAVAAAYPDKLRANPTLRKEAQWLFASRASWATYFLYRITETKEVKKEDVPNEIIRQFKLLNDPSLVDLVDQIWPAVKMASSEDKKSEIQRIHKVMQAGPGNLQKGARIYQTRCGTCHQLNNKGGNIGPDLTGYDRKNLSEIALNTVDPNAFIREGYVNYKIVMNDGQTILGTILEQTDHSIIAKPLGGNLIKINVDQIEETMPQSHSIMPERLTNTLTDQELRDLFTYISQ